MIKYLEKVKIHYLEKVTYPHYMYGVVTLGKASKFIDFSFSLDTRSNPNNIKQRQLAAPAPIYADH